MLNLELHRSIFVNILREIYSDSLLRTKLGFKGGTAAMLLYQLPRFSIDLDFDLLDLEKKEAVFQRLREILSRYGNLDEAIDKKYSIFFYINYAFGARNLKVEISKRPTSATFVLKNYLGISMLVMSKEDMAAAKFAALVTRKRFATRDMYDTWFFLKNHWEMNQKLIEEKTTLPLPNAIEKAIERIQRIKQAEILAGLGELLDTKQKVWVKEHLVDELIFQLRLYHETHKQSVQRLS